MKPFRIERGGAEDTVTHQDCHPADGTAIFPVACSQCLAQELTPGEIRGLFPHVDENAIDQAAAFEGVDLRLAA